MPAKAKPAKSAETIKSPATTSTLTAYVREKMRAAARKDCVVCQLPKDLLAEAEAGNAEGVVAADIADWLVSVKGQPEERVTADAVRAHFQGRHHQR